MPILPPPPPSRSVFPTEISRSMHTVTIRFRKNYFSDENGEQEYLPHSNCLTRTFEINCVCRVSAICLAPVCRAGAGIHHHRDGRLHQEHGGGRLPARLARCPEVLRLAPLSGLPKSVFFPFRIRDFQSPDELKC